MIACGKCGDTGWYAYDRNHSKPCEECCPHGQGVWHLLDHYGDKNGLWCCRAGCGTTWPGISDYQRARRPVIDPLTALIEQRREEFHEAHLKDDSKEDQ